MPEATHSGELVAAIDAEGAPRGGVLRAEAHKRGVWHRAVSVFVLNELGEVVVERRSKHKDLFPDCYDIVGGHVQQGQRPIDAACQELAEELGLNVESSRLERLSLEDGVVERVVLPERGIINLERKTIYLLQLEPTEEERVQKLSAYLVRLTSEELEERGTSGEVSRIELWRWEHLTEMCRSTGRRPIASGTLSAMADDVVRRAVERRCLSLRTARRERFGSRYPFVVDGGGALTDQRLRDLFLETPETIASEERAAHVFANGSRQIAGAYRMGPFRQVAVGSDHWAPKLRDPETRYVSNLFTALGFGREPAIRQELERVLPDAQSFVSDLLNFPFEDGLRFRDALGNLADIALARKAVLVWLDHANPTLASMGIATNPTQAVTAGCLAAGQTLLERFQRRRPRDSYEYLYRLILLGLGASAADFNSPAFQRLLKTRSTSVLHIADFLEASAASSLCDELGGERFFAEFYKRFVASGNESTIVYLAGNSAQACTSLSIAQEILRLNQGATVRFVAKSGMPGNDLTREDAARMLNTLRKGLLRDLDQYVQEGRFILEADGPHCHGLDPARLSMTIAECLSVADVILAEGQAYAEIRGWTRPAFAAFRVNGRVAEAIHGIARGRGEAGFVRLTPGVDHFTDFQAVVHRTTTDSVTGERIPVARQTTAEYVRAILSENLSLISRYLFHDQLGAACQKVDAEARRLDKTFAQVVMGVAFQQPDANAARKTIRESRFPVFACGGGGGFTAVTLRALRKLGLPTVAGVPSTDDGGSTGELQRWLRDKRGFVFGVGDMAAILQDSLEDRGKQALLAYRFDTEPDALTVAVMDRVVAEIAEPTYRESPIGASGDFLSFISDQLNLARVIDKTFRAGERHTRMPLKGASLRNLNVVAAYELCGALGDRDAVSDDSRLVAFYALQKALGVPPDLLVVPVTHAEGVLFVDYERPVSSLIADQVGIPPEALANDNHRLYGQQYIDKLPQRGRRRSVGVVSCAGSRQRPRASTEYISRIRQADLFVMGAGSLIGSQLAQLVVQGVLDVLLERANMRKILVLNHVKMDETMDMSLRDQVRLIEDVAKSSASADLLEGREGGRGALRIADLFTDIVVPRTVAMDIEAELSAEDIEDPSVAETVEIAGVAGSIVRVFGNKYTRFLKRRPDFVRQFQITSREVEVLSHLDQPASLYRQRSEAGRYRGALFATSDDIEYLVAQGIQRRRIHEVDCVGENWKFVKAAGAPSLEFFPGLVPEALVGIFRIVLEQSASTKL
jgi:2-phospho-L-lactate transferase/gluconeogenesis factor (CofD/UPF0052 family)/isopentenyldiphosphate isomerase